MTMTVRDAARLLSVSEKTVYRWLSERGLPAQRVGDQYRLHRSELLEWATSRRVPFRPELLEEPEDEGAGTPSLRSGIENGGIFYRLEGSGRDGVLRTVASTLRLPDGIDAEFVYRVFRSREKLASTAIGDGIALPHARHPLVLHVDQPSISVCFLESPVEFGALDGKLVSTLLVSLSPSVRLHLEVLARLAFALRDGRFREALHAQWSRSEILDEAERIDREIAQSRAVAPAEAGP